MHQVPFWLRYIPAALRSKIEHRPNLLKILGNTGWLFADKILRMGMGLLVGVWVARYLGPEQFGLLNYVMAIVALFTAIATLGLNNIVVRDLVKHPEHSNVTLGTAFILQLIGGVLATGAAVIAVSVVRPEDAAVKLMVAIVGSAMVFKASDVIRYWFESRVQSKYTVWVENAAFLVFAAGKVTLILAAAPLLAFVWIALVEVALVAMFLLYIYTQQGNRLSAWSFRYARAKTLLKDSWPLILSGMAAMLYMRIDQIMLGQMLNDAAVGIYSAASRISEVWYFIPISIVNSLMPEIIKLKTLNKDQYLKKIQDLYNFLIPLSVFIAITISAASPFIVKLLYGEGFSEAAAILSMQIWAGVFVTMGVSRGPWIIAEGLQMYTFRYIGIATIVNVVCNLVLIPKFGLMGASISSVAAHATTAIVAPLFYVKTRDSVFMLIKSLNPLNIVKLFF